MATDRDSGSDFDLTTPDFLPQDSGIKPTLDSICAEIEKSLPTIDFEISDVSSEEDVPIFHRALKTPTQEDDEDTVSFFDDEATKSKLEQLKFANPYTKRLSSKTRSDLQSSNSSKSMVTGSQFPDYSRRFVRQSNPDAQKTKSVGISNRPQSAPNKSHHDSETDSVPPLPAPLEDNWVGTDQEFSPDDELDIDIPSPTISPRSEKRAEVPELSPTDVNVKSRSKDRGGNGDSQELVSKYLSDVPTIKFENVDIEEVLSGTIARLTDGTSVMDESSTPQLVPDKEGPSLIQKLAQLSMDQSGTELQEVDASSGALKRKMGGLKDIKTARNMSVSYQGAEAASSHGESQTRVSPKDLVNLPSSQLTPSPPSRKKDEPETVYIDLRRFDENREQQKQSIERVQRVLGISPQDQSSDSSDDESEGLSWVEQRQRIKQSLRETGSVPIDLAAKPKPESQQTTVPPVSQRTQAQKLIPQARDVRPPIPPVQTTPVSVPPPASNDDNKEKIRKLEAAKKLREQRESERQSRIRLGHRLEAVRPSLSDKGHCTCAENTPTLFDIDASYEPAPQTMPFDLVEDTELVLLSVHLSSNGEMVAHRGTTHKSVDRGVGLSASYTTLVTWLLSLVPDNFDFLKVRPSEPVFAPAPFYVLGLQQMFINGELRLFVVVTPVERFTPRDAPGKTKAKAKKRDEIKDSSPFQQILTKYFSVNSLHNVCPWLQDLVSMEVTKGNLGDDGEQFIYRPPLPNITTRPLSTFIQINPDGQAAAKVFKSPIGFFWQTLETDESGLDLNLNEENMNFDTQNTMSLIYKKVYRDPRAMMGILNRVLQEGLDLTGVRLLYPTTDLFSMTACKPGLPQVGQESHATPLMMLNRIGPIVGLAIRGMYARSIWLDAVGPSDPALARRTDPNSLCALYGGESREECLLFCPRNPDRIHSELCRWFGGRVPASGVIDIGHNSRESSGSKKSKKSSTDEIEIPTHNPAATLTAVTRSDIIVAVSPLVPSKCLGLLLSTCQRRGYQLHGVKRCRLSAKRAASLGLTNLPQSVYLSEDLPIQPDTENDGPTLPVPPRPVTLLLVTKENAVHTSASLIEAFMVQMSLQGELNTLAGWLREAGSEVELTSALLFHTMPYSDSLLNSLGGDFSKVPDSDQSTTPGYITPRLHTNPELEQIVVLTLTGHVLLKTFGLFLGRLLGLVPYSKVSSPPCLKQGLELLGLKWLPSLSMQHSKELTPFEVGEPAWKPSLHKLTSEPAVVLVLRGVDAFRKLDAFLATRTSQTPHSNQQHVPITLETIMSPTPEMAYRQATMFFHKWDLHPDPSARTLLRYLPPVHKQETSHTEEGSRSATLFHNDLYHESLFQTMLSGPRPITTLLLCKPDVVQRHLAKLIRRVTQEGFRIVALRLVMLSREEASFAVPQEDKNDEILSSMHRDFLTGAPSLLLCLQRENAVKKLCDLIGPSDPKDARRMGAGLWRGMFGSDPISNGLHASCDYESAIKELQHFFPEGLCCKQNEDLENGQICCPCEDSVPNLSAYRKRDILTTDPHSSPQTVAQPTKKSSGNTCREFNLHKTALTQTNCLVLTPGLFYHESRTRRSPFVEVFDHLLNKGFQLVGARMMLFTEEQAQNFLHINDAGSFALVPLLRSGPSLILALQRDNAVMAFDSLLGSAYEKESVFAKYEKHILRPKNCSYANRLLCYFFNELIPAAQVNIITSATDDVPDAS